MVALSLPGLDMWERQPEIPPRWCGWKEIADALGCSESWAREQDIPVYQLGGGKSARVYIDRADLVAWVEKRKRETTR